MRGAIPVEPSIGIIAIDDKSIAELGRYPWTRSQYARLLDKLKAAQAKAVMFDAFFPEREDMVNDQAFAAATKKAGNVVLAVLYEFDKEGQRGQGDPFVAGNRACCCWSRPYQSFSGR